MSDKLIKFSVLLKKQYSVPLFVVAPVASAPDFGYLFDPTLPRIGSNKERNYLTYRFGKILEAAATSLEGVYIVNMFKGLVDLQLNTLSEYFIDNVHLNYKGLNLFISKFREVIEKNNINITDYYAFDQLPYSDEIILKNISHKCRLLKISSTSAGGDLVASNPALGKDFIFRTKLEDDPYVIIDIGYASVLQHLEFLFHDDLDNMSVDLSVFGSLQEDEDSYNIIASVKNYLVTSKDVFQLDLPKGRNHFRYIKISLHGNLEFCLSGLKIIERSFFVG